LIQEKYNEEEYAKKIEENGFLTNRHNYELTLLIKYWKKCGIKPKARKEKIYEFCKNNIEKFNEVKYFKRINSALRKGSRKDNPLIIIEKIPITSKDIEYINSLDIEYDYKKILFTLLVRMKIKKEICILKYGNYLQYNYLSGTQKTYNEIYEVSKISNTYKINKIINILEQLGYVDVRTRGRIKLLFIDNIEESSKIEFNVTTFDNIGYYFDWYNGDDKIIRCENCGKLIKRRNNRQKYCPTCWKEKQKELWKEASQKYRDKIKSS